ncbi:transcription repressor OFP7-like [Gossypium australe]|uniref:Transcription repressor n=1 Tax=Gossypium australe TaxID=47621 RepID=A0A5B6U8Q8_9ROSI|nr:transcription repressor OFP7-like [Gossypium australe]
MAKRCFKLKFSCIIPYFQFCRSKKPSKLPETSVSFLSTVNPKASDVGYSDLSFPAPPPSTPDYSFVKRHLSPKVASVDCGCRAARSCRSRYSTTPDVSFESTQLQVMAKAHNSKLQWRTYEASVSGKSNGKYKVNRKEKKKAKMATVSNKKKMKRLRSKKHKGLSTENKNPPWKGSIESPRTAEEKVAESVVVVKKSEDPYEDFKRSMLEMIMEKQMFEAKDLEQLLQCFLSLNSKEYHGIIVEAFTEIWEALF